VLDIKLSDVIEFVDMLKEKYNTPDSGINILFLEDNVQMCTNPAFVEPVRSVLDLRRNVPLSQAAMEVLAVIAYNQPVTKSFVEQVRGVDCSGVVGSLVEKGLLEERGRLELPGRPLLYGTTDTFLRCFNISSISELPPPPSMNEDEVSETEKEDLNEKEETGL
jgi:segregation and condensation protein B